MVRKADARGAVHGRVHARLNGFDVPAIVVEDSFIALVRAAGVACVLGCARGSVEVAPIWAAIACRAVAGVAANDARVKAARVVCDALAVMLGAPNVSGVGCALCSSKVAPVIAGVVRATYAAVRSVVVAVRVVYSVIAAHVWAGWVLSAARRPRRIAAKLAGLVVWAGAACCRRVIAFVVKDCTRTVR